MNNAVENVNNVEVIDKNTELVNTPVNKAEMIEVTSEKYIDYLELYTHKIKKPTREIIGREEEMMKLNAGLSRPEYCNVILLAEAGTGKTALVQGLMLKDEQREYYEVDLSKMIADLPDPNEMAARLKALFDQVEALHNKEQKEIVLFMDEFHQVVQLSDASVEALKPLLADSGTRGIKVIAATTLKEFDQFIAPNQPLVERLQRINVPEPGKDMTISILKGFAKSYGVEYQFYNDSIYELIYEYTNRYIPANAQPRKSILMLDSMVGWHRVTKRPMDKKLLAEVIYQNQGINVSFRVDAVNIKKQLDAAVYAQDLATTIVSNRLQIAVADLNNKSKPMASFLFTGSTGVGKGLTNETVVPVYTEDGSVCEKLNGDLQIGDYVFNRKGKPVKVVGVFPRGLQDIYEVTLTDGRKIQTDSSHLWTFSEYDVDSPKLYTRSTKELYDDVLSIQLKDGTTHCRYYIPMNNPVQYKDIFLLDKPAYEKGRNIASNYSNRAHIPSEYMYGSIDTRSTLIRTLFEYHGKNCSDTMYTHIYSGCKLSFAEDLSKVLWSLGFVNVIEINDHNFYTDYNVKVDFNKRDWVGIANIEKLDVQKETTCIYVDDEEHLYQAGQYIVTHNTEMTKQLASILFGRDRDADENQSSNKNLIRFDMTEFANPSSLELFREEITAKIWERPYSVVLLDEIEKSCAEVTRVLLQVLDDGRLTDRHGRQVVFTNCYIIMTTNAGAEIYETISQYGVSDTGDGKAMKTYMKLIRRSISETTGANRFPPELLGRIDEIVPFQPLSEETMRKIVINKLKKLANEIQNKHGVDVRFDKKIVNYLVLDNLDTSSKSGGARIVLTKLEQEVTMKLASFINANPGYRTVTVVVKGNMAWDNKELLHSEAWVEVLPDAQPNVSTH